MKEITVEELLAKAEQPSKDAIPIIKGKYKFCLNAESKIFKTLASGIHLA